MTRSNGRGGGGTTLAATPPPLTQQKERSVRRSKCLENFHAIDQALQSEVKMQESSTEGDPKLENGISTRMSRKTASGNGASNSPRCGSGDTKTLVRHQLAKASDKSKLPRSPREDGTAHVDRRSKRKSSTSELEVEVTSPRSPRKHATPNLETEQ